MAPNHKYNWLCSHYFPALLLLLLLCIVHTFFPKHLVFKFLWSYTIFIIILLKHWNAVNSRIYIHMFTYYIYICTKYLQPFRLCMIVSVHFSILPWWLHVWLIWAYVFSLFMDSRVKELFSCADAHLTCYLRLASLKWNVRHPKTLFLWSAK